MRILWIDDEIDLLRPFIYALEKKGYQVQTATNGPDGLTLLATKGFDLVLLDQMMTGMQGLDVLNRIKELDQNVLVAMVTKSDDEVLINEAIGKLVDDFIIKPFTPAQLLAVLKRLLEKRQLVTRRITQDFLRTINQPRELATCQSWVEYYRVLVYWQNLLARFGENSLWEIYYDQRREANNRFAQFVEENYLDWLTTQGPLMSHRLIERLVKPLWEEKPTYFVVLDAMRQDQWEAIIPLLRDLFDIDTTIYYSILPTATPYSRNAIFSGLLPLEIHRRFPRWWVFEETGQNRFEAELFCELLRRLGFKSRHSFIKVGRDEELAGVKPMLFDPGVRLTVLVVNFLDVLIHSVRTNRLLDDLLPDDTAVVGATRVWFASSLLFDLFQQLARKNCYVVITSDHGFIRVNRPTLIYGSREMSANLRYKHGGALRVEERGALLLSNPERYFLPVEYPGEKFAIAKSDYYFIYPTKPREYENTYKHTLQHGGISLEEMVVPVAILKPRRISQ